MGKYLLDTTVLIDHLQGRRQATELISSLTLAGNELGVCSISVAELYSGISDAERAVAGKLVDSLEYWDATKETAKAAGSYRFSFARRGVTLTTTDALIAAVAVAHNAILVTANTKHYPMKDIGLLRQP